MQACGTLKVKAGSTRWRGQTRRRLTRATSKASAGENRRVKPEAIEGVAGSFRRVKPIETEGTAGSFRRVKPMETEGIAEGAGQVKLEGAGGTTDEGNLGGK